MNKSKSGQWYLNNTKLETWATASAFSDYECDEIIEYCENNLDRNPSEISNPDQRINKDVRLSTVGFLSSSDTNIQWLFDKCALIVNEINNKLWGFNLDYIETLQYTSYNTPGDKYTTHVDFLGTGPHYRKLSFSIQLDSPNTYQGGDLIISPDYDPVYAKKDRGTIIFFPSFITHEVTPLISGQRRSLVGWVCGPSFK